MRGLKKQTLCEVIRMTHSFAEKQNECTIRDGHFLQALLQFYTAVKISGEGLLIDGFDNDVIATISCLVGKKLGSV